MSEQNKEKTKTRKLFEYNQYDNDNCIVFSVSLEYTEYLSKQEYAIYVLNGDGDITRMPRYFTTYCRAKKGYLEILSEMLSENEEGYNK